MSQNALSLLHFNPKQMKGESKRYQSQKPNPKVQRPVPQKQAIQQSFEQLKDEKVSKNEPTCSSIDNLNSLCFFAL